MTFDPLSHVPHTRISPLRQGYYFVMGIDATAALGQPSLGTGAEEVHRRKSPTALVALQTVRGCSERSRTGCPTLIHIATRSGTEK